MSRGAWQLVRLGDIADVRGGSGFPNHFQGKPSGDFPFYKVSDMNSEGNEVYLRDAHNWITSRDADTLGAKPFARNTLVFPKVGAALFTNKKRLLSRDAIVDNNVMGVTLRDRNCLPDFLLYWFLGIDLGQLSNPGPLPSINGARVKEVQIPIPPIDEQRAIAHVLQTVQKAKETRQCELALERERKAALMEHLFTHGTRAERTKKTEFGSIPESWKVSTLGALCEDHLGILQTGPFGSQLHASDYVETGVPVVNPTHLGFNSIEKERVPRVSKELADTLPKHYLLRGDILISRRGDFSRFAYIGEDESGWFCGTGCMLIRLANPAMDNYFFALSMSLNSTQSYLKNAAVGSIMPNLNTTILSQMPVLIPPMEEQCQIAAVIRACERKIRVMESEIPVVEELFAAMLAELMSGRVSTGPLSEVLSTQ